MSGAGACATEEEEEDQEDEIADLEIADLASVCCQADMEVEKYVGSFVEDDDMEPTDQPVPLGEQGMEVVKDDGEESEEEEEDELDRPSNLPVPRDDELEMSVWKRLLLKAG